MADPIIQGTDDASGLFTASRAAVPQRVTDAQWDAIGSDVPAGRVATAGGAAARAAVVGGAAAAANAMQGAPSDVSMPRRIIGGLWAATKDITGGVVGAPKQVAGGALDYANNLMKFADTVVKHAEDAGVPNVYFRLFDKDGNWSPKISTPEEFRAAQKAGNDQVFQVPTTGGADTVTGAVIRTGTSFLAGRGTMAKGGGMAANAVADFVSGATSMDPNEKRLSNVIDEAAPNFITQWLKAKPEEEGTIMAHVKSGLEMAGLGALVTSTVNGLKAIKNAVSGGSEGAAGPLADAAQAVAPTGPVNPEPGSGLPRTVKVEGKPVPLRTEPNPADAAGLQTESSMVGLKDDLPWLKENGWPTPESGKPLAPVQKSLPTVQVSPELKANFEKFMAQERGELPAPLSAVEGQANASLRSADFSSTGANPVKVNLNMINGPEDLKDAIARVSSQIPEQAVRRNDAVVDAANALGMRAEDFLAGPGGALKDTEVVGLRMVANDTAMQFLNLAKEAAAPGAAPEAKAQALAAYSKLNGLLTYMEGAKAESGRSVQAWGIQVAGMKVPYLDAVTKIAEMTGGPESDAFFGKLAQLDTPEAVAAAARQARIMSGKDWFMYGYYNALLRPRTIVKKAVSDLAMATWNTAVRYTAEKFGGNVPAGETGALLQGYTGSFKDGLRMAAKALQTGRSQFMSEMSTLDSFDKATVDTLMEQAPEALSEAAPTGGAVEYLRSIATSPKSLLPTTWIGAFDDFAKTINYRAELRSLAYRQAATKGLEGAELESVVNDLVSNPSSALHKQAVSAALSNTFQDPLTGIAASLKNVADDMTLPLGHGSNFELPVGRILLPFVKVPVNIARWSYTNSPLPALMPSSRMAAELAAGGATRDLAIARMGLGTALVTTFTGMALAGGITGKGPSERQLNQAWKAAGNEPHSVVIGDKQYSYNSLEPMGLMAGVISDTIDIMRFAKEEDAGQAALSLVFGAGQALLSKTYLEGVANFFGALENPDQESARYVQNLISGAVVPGTIADFRNAIDPWMRTHYDLLQTIQNRLPYISEGLPPQRTLWGDPVPVKDAFMPLLSGTGAAKMLSPVQIGPAVEANPIDKWIWEHRLDFPRGPDNKLGITRPGLIQSFAPRGGSALSIPVELTPQQHDRLAVLAGNELKDNSTDMGAKDTLNALVEGKYPNSSMQSQWDRSSDAVRAMIVQQTINKFRHFAKIQLLEEFPDLKETVEANWQARAAQLTGTQ